MIRPLRRRHRALVGALVLLLPAGFITGIAARKPLPVVQTLPPELAGSAADYRESIWTRADLWPGQRIVTSLRRNGAGAVAVELAFRDLTRPDVLVYWISGRDAAGGSLPAHARLLGVLLDGVPLPFPPEAQGKAGRLLLYSLADHEVVAESNPIPQ